MTERWVPIVGYEGFYEVSDAGRVRRVDSGHVITQRVSAGYANVSLSRPGRRIIRKVHRLVAEAFVPRAEGDRLEVCHNNGVKLDNSSSNLRWDTHQENLRDMVRHGAPHLGPKTVCRKGLHPMTDENTIKNGGGRRLCATCHRARRQLKWAREEGA